jgi:preprotein translocase subunit YajC
VHVLTILALQADSGAGIRAFIPMIAIIAIFYFVLIVPQRREQKRHREMVAALKTGDEVLTAGGVIGEIIAIKEERVTLKSGDARLVVDRARVARKLNA